jgi:hypothetical protein
LLYEERGTGETYYRDEQSQDFANTDFELVVRQAEDGNALTLP